MISCPIINQSKNIECIDLYDNEKSIYSVEYIDFFDILKLIL